MPRRVNPFCASAWDEAGPWIRRIIARKAKRPALAELTAEQLTAEQMLVIAHAAGAVAWLFSEVEALAPYERGKAEIAFDHQKEHDEGYAPELAYPELTL
jgi:hypothetical protein